MSANLFVSVSNQTRVAPSELLELLTQVEQYDASPALILLFLAVVFLYREIRSLYAFADPALAPAKIRGNQEAKEA